MNTDKELKEVQYIHDFFEISILLKGFDGLLEVFGGILILFATPKRVFDIAQYITRGELLQDPHDFIANYIVNFATNFTHSTEIFTSIFLLSHGVIKILLVIALLKKKHWAYPLAIIVFGILGAYQTYQFLFSHSIILLLITLLDVVVIILTWLEYQNLKKAIK